MITGASSGLGTVFARRFAQSGYDLIITGRRKDKLIPLAEELESVYNISATPILAELSDENDIGRIIRVIENQHDIHILVNNAGFGSGQEFCRCDLETHLQMLQVHVTATLKLVHAVLPQMIDRKEGIILNVSSLGAFMPAPGSSMYSATKMFLKTFSESLHMEVGRLGIRVHCLCPGFTKTAFHERRAGAPLSGESRLIPWMSAETVVDESLKAIRKGKIVFVPGIANRLMIGITSILPRFIYYLIMAKFTKKPGRIQKSSRKISEKVKPAFSLFYRIQHLIEKAVPGF